MTAFHTLNPGATLSLPNTFQAGAGNPVMNGAGSTNSGICTLSHGGKIFHFRTNPTSVWWTYDLITHVEETYGGRVVQILGTKLGDLSVKVECGSAYGEIGGQQGGWPYLMNMVNYLIDMLEGQRSGETATFEYTTRKWKLGVYALTVPFQDQVTATTRELELVFKIQEDISGVVSQLSLSGELAALQDGVYRPNQNVHNEFNDSNQAGTTLNGFRGVPGSVLAGIGVGGVNQNLESGPAYAQPSATNTVDTHPQGGQYQLAPGQSNTQTGLTSLLPIP